MSDIAIKVENLGKLYRLGEVGTGTISHDLNRWFAKIRGKEDPFAKIGEANDRTKKGESDYVWALKDVNFEVKKGEVLGIIGRNGAGKSTLLKLLSKVTQPSTGNIKVKGRIASLLEVGTGFHPELTGRENIFLNGAILGMTRPEIRAKFEEIVDFAGVERYIDTPVKRYSSGMYVRLAFAVAAFLEPEILIVDEVLAVGDAEFQKKCLGRMKDISINYGRTILFVSHDLSAIDRLCSKSVLLSNGELSYQGLTKEVVMHYYNHQKGIFNNIHLTNSVSIKNISIGKEINYWGESIPIELIIEYKETSPILTDLCILIYNNKGHRVAILDLRPHFTYLIYNNNTIEFKGSIERCNLVEGEYQIGIYYGDNSGYKEIHDISTFYIGEKINSQYIKYQNQYRGNVHFKIEQVNEKRNP